ncbi:MAG: N-acetyl-gamma-glutamyl-phosphate reductase [Candidatus Omnitrophica bacterium]|nr:N-acetyl-gamma-glutamyl-phosphate reductase [Candidatus Omnitrophota bacterium]MBU4478562.1 N-acetyl-gamma-glutamyl-phosphate reductase [Candidatus Omnitrophota bacterium]MCG2703561.1 N-acetyl-gamma-glutamyl-phosphate reductase [Candidatus Omnitrophota bacterium]
MLKAAILGASGYAGEELIKILLRHPEIKISYLMAKMDESCPISDLFPWLEHILEIECKNEIDVESVAAENDVIFLALPHRVSMDIAPSFLNLGKRVIDFSADYRLKDVDEYQKWYDVEHKSKEFVKYSVYGLCELYREKIKDAQLIANPGCYPTGAILTCAPFLKSGLIEPDIIIDAKSGSSGAGRTPSVKLLFSEVNENFKAYKVCNHQHTPEIVQELNAVYGAPVHVSFVPHLVPINRGILSTIYMSLKKTISVFDAVDILKKFYHNEPFVRVRKADVYPEIKDVVCSNFCDMGIKVDQKRLIVVTAIDNLVKGAAGQAVQNCNIMFGFKETTGLL